MSYSEIATRATGDALRHLGEDAVYHSASAGDISMVAADGEGLILQKDVELEEEGGVFIRRHVAAFKSGLVTPASGDSITLGGTTYSVEKLLADDGYMTRVVLGRRV